jgi:26S proteasome regulatory subunit N10
MSETIEQCEDLGKRLKRNNVAIDIINFANSENVDKLTALVNAANNSSNSHFMDVPMGISMITDVLITSPILMGEDVDMSSGGAGQPGATGAGQFAEYGGINPDLEPELAMALKVSLEEEAARLKKTEDQVPQTTNTPADDQPMQEQEEEFDEEYYLQ